MEGIKVNEMKITLVLNEVEGSILAGLMQNSQVPPEEETTECSKLREAIFKLCKPSGIK